MAAMAGAAFMFARNPESARYYDMEVTTGGSTYFLAWAIPFVACIGCLAVFVVTSWPAIMAIVAEARAE